MGQFHFPILVFACQWKTGHTQTWRSFFLIPWPCRRCSFTPSGLIGFIKTMPWSTFRASVILLILLTSDNPPPTPPPTHPCQNPCSLLCVGMNLPPLRENLPIRVIASITLLWFSWDQWASLPPTWWLSGSVATETHSIENNSAPWTWAELAALNRTMWW